jgi:hypothetical protein
MSQYLLSICYSTGAPRPSAAAMAAIMKEVEAIRREMQAAGAWVFAAGLQGSDTATVVRIEEGRALVTDGPFIESKEQIGGICVIDAADPDAALAWGTKLSRAVTTPVEVRPLTPQD